MNVSRERTWHEKMFKKSPKTWHKTLMNCKSLIQISISICRVAHWIITVHKRVCIIIMKSRRERIIRRYWIITRMCPRLKWMPACRTWIKSYLFETVRLLLRRKRRTCRWAASQISRPTYSPKTRYQWKTSITTCRRIRWTSISMTTFTETLRMTLKRR